MDELLYWIWFAEVFSYGSIKPAQVLSEYATAKEFYEHREQCRKQFSFVSAINYKRIMRYSPSDYAPIVDICTQKGINILTYDHPDYPRRLKTIDCPPMVLYYVGDLSGLSAELCIGMVGTRYPSNYSMGVAQTIARDLSVRGATVISGCAEGIDTCVHRGGLEGKGITISVLGTALDKNYPASNVGLKRTILQKGGALISEYPPGTVVQHMHFPIRNRLVSGLSDGIVVVEAPRKSGALITAQAAIEQGRELFCVPPADIFNPRYNGVQKYLRDGAHALLATEDIYNTYRFIYTPMDLPQTNFHKKPDQEDFTSDVTSTVSIDIAQLSEDAKMVYQTMQKQPMSLEQISAQSSIPVFRLMSAITELEMSGAIRKYAGRQYQKVQL